MTEADKKRDREKEVNRKTEKSRKTEKLHLRQNRERGVNDGYTNRIPNPKHTPKYTKA